MVEYSTDCFCWEKGLYETFFFSFVAPVLPAWTSLTAGLLWSWYCSCCCSSPPAPPTTSTSRWRCSVWNTGRGWTSCTGAYVVRLPDRARPEKRVTQGLVDKPQKCHDKEEEKKVDKSSQQEGKQRGRHSCNAWQIITEARKNSGWWIRSRWRELKEGWCW